MVHNLSSIYFMFFIGACIINMTYNAHFSLKGQRVLCHQLLQYPCVMIPPPPHVTRRARFKFPSTTCHSWASWCHTALEQHQSDNWLHPYTVKTTAVHVQHIRISVCLSLEIHIVSPIQLHLCYNSFIEHLGIAYSNIS
jgi:hypothetical protein